MRKYFVIMLAIGLLVGLSAQAFAQQAPVVVNKASNPNWVEVPPRQQLGDGVERVNGRIEMKDPRCMIQGKIFSPPGKAVRAEVVCTNCTGNIDDRVEPARVWATEKAAQVRANQIPSSCLDDNGRTVNNCYVREF